VCSFYIPNEVQIWFWYATFYWTVFITALRRSLVPLHKELVEHGNYKALRANSYTAKLSQG